MARDAYAPVLEVLAGDAGGLAAGVEERTRRDGVTFGAAEDGLLALDPVPRLIDATEWQRVVRGVTQRADALERFLEDVYGEREIVAAAESPSASSRARSTTSPRCARLQPPWISVIGFDSFAGPMGVCGCSRTRSGCRRGSPTRAAAREISPTCFRSSAASDEIAAGFSRLGGALRVGSPTGR